MVENKLTYRNLERELKERNERIESTILEAGRAHINKNMAEDELRRIKMEERKQRKEFETEFVAVSKEMKNIRRFKEFLKQKKKERTKLEAIEREIVEHRNLISNRI